MRIFSKAVGCLLGIGSLAAAGAARADGFWVTLKDGSGNVLGERVQGAVFDASATTPTTMSGDRSASPKYSPARIEIDQLSRLLVPSLDALAQNKKLSAVVEFTAPSGDAGEQVYMVATFSDVLVNDWQLSYTGGATPTAVHTLELGYAKVVYAAPPPPAGKRPFPLRALPTALPVVKRLSVVKAPAPRHVDDAYLKSASLPDESADHSGRSRLTSYFHEVVSPRDAATGMASGKIVVKSLSTTKAVGAATPTLQSDLSTHKVLPALEIDFVQHGATETRLFAVQLDNASVTGDAVQVANGASAETTKWSAPKLKVVDDGAGTSAQVTP